MGPVLAALHNTVDMEKYLFWPCVRQIYLDNKKTYHTCTQSPFLMRTKEERQYEETYEEVCEDSEEVSETARTAPY